MLYGRNRTSTTGYGYNQRTPKPLTKQLFKAIDNENLEAFKQAIAEGADVNAFDEEGMTPLMSIARACDASYDKQPVLEKMAKLLIQNNNIKINVQGKQPVYKERQKKDSQDRVVFRYLGKEIGRDDSSGSKHFILRDGWGSINANKFKYIDSNKIVTKDDDDNEPIWFTTDDVVGRHDENAGFKILKEYYDGVKEQIRTSEIQRNTALHIACQVGAKDIVKILLTHPDIKTDVRNCEDKDPKDCIARGFEDTIKLELERAQKGKQLLNVLSSGNIYQAKGLLNQELNPNCWKRNQNGEIETPLSLIIRSCLQGITQDNKEVLTKLLKHKDLDFSQIRSIPAIEKNIQLKQPIEQAITERLADAINRKDLGDVKELVEDNCFINRAIVTAALRNVNNPIESITNYLNEKFPANTNNIPKDFEGFVEELEKTKAQLVEKEQELTNKTVEISQLERDLKQVREERDRLSSEIRTTSLSNKNEKPSRTISLGKKQSNYASACFISLGICAVDSCLVIEDYPGMSAFFAAFALVFLLVGCYSLYKANTVLSDVESTQLGGLGRS